MKLVEQLTLVTLQTAHHGSTSPRFASTQRNHASRPVSTDFCNKIGNKLRIPAQGGRQGGGIERPAQPLATAINVADTNLFAAVVVIGSNPGERCGLGPRDPAELGPPP